MFAVLSRRIEIAGKMSDLMSLKNPIFWNYLGCSTVCFLKMAMMGPLTGRQRIKNKAFANEEDVAVFGGDKVALNHPAVEKLRRNHLNDLENIPMFVALGGLYVLTRPDEYCAKTHFIVFTLSRLGHTIAYQTGYTRARAICYAVGTGMTVSIAIQIFITLWKSR